MDDFRKHLDQVKYLLRSSLVTCRRETVQTDYIRGAHSHSRASDRFNRPVESRCTGDDILDIIERIENNYNKCEKEEGVGRIKCRVDSEFFTLVYSPHNPDFVKVTSNSIYHVGQNIFVRLQSTYDCSFDHLLPLPSEK